MVPTLDDYALANRICDAIDLEKGCAAVREVVGEHRDQPLVFFPISMELRREVAGWIADYGRDQHQQGSEEMNKHKITITSGLKLEGPGEFFHNVTTVAEMGGLELGEAREIEATVAEGGAAVTAKLGEKLAAKRSS